MPAWQTARSWIIKSLPGVVLGAIMYASQVTPEQASSNLAAWFNLFGATNLPPWVQARNIDTLVFLSAFGCLVIYGVWIWWNREKYISMPDAARILYEESLAVGSPWAYGAESMSGSGITRGSSNDILDYMACSIAYKVPIHGKRSPSTRLEPINKKDWKGRGFEGGGLRLQNHFVGGSSLYTDICVKEGDLLSVINEMKSQLKELKGR